MKQQVQIEFQGMKPVQSMHDDIMEHVAALETRFGRIISCRVALRAPNPRHRVGGHYEVNIRLALPDGREVNVARTATADERLADLTFAINDAFKRARRQLQDGVRRMQGQVKAHGEPSIGTVAKFDLIDEIGFIETSDGREIYFHPNAVRNGGLSKLKERRPRYLPRGGRTKRSAGQHRAAARQARMR